MKKRYLIPTLLLLLCGLFAGCEKEASCSHQLVTTVVREATCVKAGQLNHSCSLCGRTFTQSTPNTDHCFTEIVTREASCSEDGIITATCSHCGTAEETHIPAVSHTFDFWSFTPDRCTVCGETVEGAAADPANPWYGKNWVALGTSLTSEAQGTFVAPLAKRTGLSVTNLGIPGGTAINHILQSAQTADLSGADLITVEFGVNDWVENISLGSVGDTVPYLAQTDSWNNGGTEEGTFAGACYQIFKTLQKRAPQAVIIFLTEPTGQKFPDTNGNCTREKVNYLGLTQWNYTETALATARYMGIRTIDAGSMSMINQNHPQYLADQIHHSELGGAQYALTVWSALKDIAPLLTAE